MTTASPMTIKIAPPGPEVKEAGTLGPPSTPPGGHPPPLPTGPVHQDFIGLPGPAKKEGTIVDISKKGVLTAFLKVINNKYPSTATADEKEVKKWRTALKPINGNKRIAKLREDRIGSNLANVLAQFVGEHIQNTAIALQYLVEAAPDGSGAPGIDYYTANPDKLNAIFKASNNSQFELNPGYQLNLTA